MFFIRSKVFLIWVLLPVFIYLSLYTWNWRTGYLDRLSAYTGMEFVGWILLPGEWLEHQVVTFWNNYVNLIEVNRQNIKLKKEIKALRLQNIQLRQQALQARRLRRFLNFSPPENWSFLGARVIGHRLGPNAALKTLLVSKGSFHGAREDMPALVPEGVVGRILQTSPHFSKILLITDPNSRIPVVGQMSRTHGVISGQGPAKHLQVKYVPLNSPLYKNEVLITSGLAGIFPKGLPVARVINIQLSDLSLFKKVQADPLVNMKRLEELLLLQKNEQVSSKEDLKQ